MEKNDIKKIIKDLLTHSMVFSDDVEVEEDENESKGKNLWYKVKINDSSLFTSRDGEALFALNYLIKRIFENKYGVDEEIPYNVILDINDFQKKRIDNIKTIAHMMAERARYFKSNIEVDPMSSFERRIVHEFLQDATDLKTESEGFGLNRRVIIKYIGNI